MKNGDLAIWSRYVWTRGYGHRRTDRVRIVNWNPRRVTADVVLTLRGYEGNPPIDIRKRARKEELTLIETHVPEPGHNTKNRSTTMKKNEVKIGQAYRVKVSGSIADVRITGVNANGGWDGVNIATNRKVRIKTAQRLRGKTPKRPAKRKKIVSLDEYEAEAKREQASAERAAGQVRKDIAKSVSAVVNGDLAKGVTVPAGKKRSGEKPMSCLTAAAQILKERGRKETSLSCGQMIERMAAKGYWKPRKGGKTPANTLYSAILREIGAKGDASRFRKAERGKFTLTAKR